MSDQQPVAQIGGGRQTPPEPDPYIRVLVDQAPPLTEQQRTTLAAILRPAATSEAEAA